MHFYVFWYFLVLFCFITFTAKCFVLAVAAISAELRAILPYKICKILLFLWRFVNSAYGGEFFARWPILRKILHAQNCRILTSLVHRYCAQ